MQGLEGVDKFVIGAVREWSRGYALNAPGWSKQNQVSVTIIDEAQPLFPEVFITVKEQGSVLLGGGYSGSDSG